VNPEDPVLKKLDIIAKLLYIQIRPGIEGLKAKLVKTEKQKLIYNALDGKRSIDEVAKSANASVRLVEKTLPEWERQGLILGFGKGAGKRYVSIENLEV
jgi:predicted Rossmann fold nucleotide-binding protein DprA/Smf involved in DNA uptake